MQRVANGALPIDRRRLVKLGLSASVLAGLPLAACGVDADLSTELLRFVSDSEDVIDGGRTGRLNDEAFATLFSLCEFVDKAWAFEADLDGYREQLRFDLELKTMREPSYLTEYEHAVELVDRVRCNTRTENEAWLTLLYTDIEDADRGTSRLGRARRFVFAEIVSHQIPISGAFKSLGFINYRGYFGGSYTASTSYRRAT